jgi:lipoprotein-releasing system permease protein
MHEAMEGNVYGALRTIRGVPGVVGASPIRIDHGLLKPAKTEAPPSPVLVKGVDPATTRSTSSLFDTLRPRPVEQLQEGEIILGAELAENQGLHVGDQVAVVFMRLDLGLGGLQPRMAGFRVAGIFRSHLGEYDRTWTFIHIKDAMALAGTDQAEMIEVRTRGMDAIGKVKPAVLGILNHGRRVPFLAQDLRDTNRALFAALKVEKWVFGAILGLIVLIAAFNIVGSLVLLVTEKRRDLGLLLALGATPRQIERIFELQSLRIGAVGTAWGLGTSVPFCLLADRYRLVKLPSAVYEFLTYLPFRLHLLDLLLVAVFPLVVAWLASRYPARRASRLDPVDALRSE